MPLSPAPGEWRWKDQEFTAIHGCRVKNEVGRGRQSGTPEEDDVRVEYNSVLVCGGHGVRRVGKQCSVAEDYSCFIRTVQGSGMDASEPKGPAMKQ